MCHRRIDLSAALMSDAYAKVLALFDSYSRTARLYPGLMLFLAPASVGVGLGISRWPEVTALGAVFVAAGMPLAIADWVRRRGQHLQSKLWNAWGGNPVLVELRKSGPVADRRRGKLAAATGFPLSDPDDLLFEETMTNAIRQLISATRDTSKYPLVFQENKNYGFARNLLAIRSSGVRVSAAATFAGIVSMLASFQFENFSLVATTAATLTASGVLLFWIFFPGEERVQAAANDYRDRLLEALDAGV